MWRRSFGKSIGGALLHCRSLNCWCRYNNYISGTNPLYHYHGFTSSYNFSSLIYQRSNYHEHHESKCEIELEAKVGSKFNLGMGTSNTPKSWKELKKKNIKYQKVTKGDVIDLREFLFTECRDYLIRYDDKTLVKAEELAGKVIILYFVSLSLYLARLHEEFDRSLFLNVYNQLRHSRDIEIVFIGIDDGNLSESEKIFEDIFCRMPWTAIPFSDVISRRNLQLNFHVNDTTTAFVVDSTGVVLQRDAKLFIEDYGVMGFPYSDERIKLLDAEDDAAVQQPSLINLLGSSERDYVITNTEEKVPIHTLEDKAVALYFYEDGVCGFKDDIVSVYEELARTKENFEVVLVYLTDTQSTFHRTSEETFWKAFKTMPWLALPFNDPNIQKLKRVFEYPETHDDEHFNERPSLVIFGPHGEYIEPLGNCILGEYPVYPFTCENVAKLETKRVQDLKMEMLWDPNMIFKKIDGSQMEISELAGKRVIIFFETEKDHEEVHYFLVKLKDKYLEMKGTDDEFEVIHILEKEVDPMLLIQNLPWFVSLACELLPDGFDFSESCGYDFRLRCLSTLLAFDRDGKLVRRTIFPAFENTEFPFYFRSMEEETLSQLIDLYGWDYWNFYPKKGRIYTLHKKLRQPSCSLGGGYRIWSINTETS